MTGDIILYSTGCPKCKILKNKLESKGVHYTENTDIDEMIALGMKSAPALKVGDEMFDFGHAVTWVNNQEA